MSRSIFQSATAYSLMAVGFSVASGTTLPIHLMQDLRIEWLTVIQILCIFIVRDAFQVSGSVGFNAQGRVIKIILNQKALWAKKCLKALNVLLKPDQVAVILGET